MDKTPKKNIDILKYWKRILSHFFRFFYLFAAHFFALMVNLATNRFYNKQKIKKKVFYIIFTNFFLSIC